MLNRGAKIADPDKEREAFLAETCAAPASPIDWSNLYSTEGLPGSGREVPGFWGFREVPRGPQGSPGRLGFPEVLKGFSGGSRGC